MSTIITSGATVLTPELILLFEDESEAGTLVHPKLGTSNPDVTLRRAAAPTGKLRLLFLTAEEAQSARDAHMAAAVFTIVTDEVTWLPSSYVPNGSIRRVQQNDDRDRWVLEVDYQEVSGD